MAPPPTVAPASGAPAPGGRLRWAEPARPDWLRRRPGACYWALGAVCIGAFMGQLDASIVTVALPTFQHVFGAGVAAVTWVGLGYLVVLVGAVTAVGRLADMVGRKLLYLYGFALFVVGSALCALAPSLVVLVVFRVVQGLGAALLQANSVAIIRVVLPEDRLGRGLGIQGAAQALGLALGPTIGGLLVAAGGWRLIFVVNVPAGLLGAAAAWVFVPRSRHLQRRGPFDRVGLALFFPAVLSALVVLSFGARWGWASWGSAGLIALALAAGGGFVAWERRRRFPLIELGLFRRVAFRAGVAGSLLAYVVLFGTLFAVPFFLERARGASVSHTGLVLTTVPLALGCVAPLSGRLAERYGTRPLAVAGTAVTALAWAVTALARPHGAWLAGALALIGAGLGLFVAPNNTAVMSAVARRQAGMAGGIVNTTRGLGTALGLALTGLVFTAFAGPAGPAGAGRGFAAAGLFLAAVAALASLCSAAGGRRTPPPPAPGAGAVSAVQ